MPRPATAAHNTMALQCIVGLVALQSISKNDKTLQGPYRRRPAGGGLPFPHSDQCAPSRPTPTARRMRTSIALLATLFTLTGCHFRSSYDSYGSSYNSIGGSRSRTDEYGTYYYDR